MTVKMGISGFGRIGRCTFRTSFLRPDVEVAAINSRTVGPIMADLLKFDTVHGQYVYCGNGLFDWKILSGNG